MYKHRAIEEVIQKTEKGVKGILITGSQQYHLMQNVSESLAGRIAILELSCLSLRELTDCSFCMPFIPTEEYIKAQYDEFLRCIGWNCRKDPRSRYYCMYVQFRPVAK